MELGAVNEGEMGMPISVSSYGHMTAIHESNSKLSGDNGTALEEIRPHEQSLKKTLRYRECLKNHAASIGGHANDGCGEFMPSGDEGTLEALKCAACNCHRNFHRREVNGEPPCYYCWDMSGRKRGNAVVPLALPSSPLPRSHPQMIMALNSHGGLIRESSEEHDHTASTMYMPVMKKRFRTKFTQEQKDRMYAFAEQLGWRIQKHDDVAVQQFCMDVGVKRHVLKVWMHNNKHTFAKKL